MFSCQSNNRKWNFQYTSPCQSQCRECRHELGSMDCRRLSCMDWRLYVSLARCGLMVASYAELGSAIPTNGGSYAYLQYIFGPLSAFLFSWTTITATKSGSAAILSLIFAEYVNRVLILFLMPNDMVPRWADKLVALLCVWMIIGLNAMGSGWATIINNIFTIIKLTALVGITCIGIVVLCTILCE